MALGRRAMVLAAGAVAVRPAFADQASGLTDLYSGRAITTGMDGRARAEGLERCLRAALVKVSGNPALAEDPRVPQPDGLLESFVYLDRMSDLPHRDEQGSRDRPYDLRAWFVPARIDAVLAQLGERPWLAQRPTLTLAVTMQRGGEPYRLRPDGDADERPRAALFIAAERYGLHVVLPLLDEPPPADRVPVRGTVVWSDTAFGWVAHWSLTSRAQAGEWGISGVSFDEAFRNLLAGALKILSGHGAP